MIVIDLPVVSVKFYRHCWNVSFDKQGRTPLGEIGFIVSPTLLREVMNGELEQFNGKMGSSSMEVIFDREEDATCFLLKWR